MPPRSTRAWPLCPRPHAASEPTVGVSETRFELCVTGSAVDGQMVVTQTTKTSRCSVPPASSASSPRRRSTDVRAPGAPQHGRQPPPPSAVDRPIAVQPPSHAAGHLVSADFSKISSSRCSVEAVGREAPRVAELQVGDGDRPRRPLQDDTVAPVAVVDRARQALAVRADEVAEAVVGLEHGDVEQAGSAVVRVLRHVAGRVVDDRERPAGGAGTVARRVLGRHDAPVGPDPDQSCRLGDGPVRRGALERGVAALAHLGAGEARRCPRRGPGTRRRRRPGRRRCRRSWRTCTGSATGRTLAGRRRTPTARFPRPPPE